MINRMICCCFLLNKFFENLLIFKLKVFLSLCSTLNTKEHAVYLALNTVP